MEVILTLLAFSVLYPDCVHLARGNHESKNMNAMYGFDGEVRSCLPMQWIVCHLYLNICPEPVLFGTHACSRWPVLHL